MRKLLAVLVCAIPFQVMAAGYLEFDTNGNPYKWDVNAGVSYKIDKAGGTDTSPALGGALGLNRIQSDTIVKDALTKWEPGNLPGATLTFTQNGYTSSDITDANINSFVNFNGTSCPTPDFVVVYDNDGKIFADLFGSSSTNVLGLSSPSVLNDSTKKITCGYALINGAAVPNSNAQTTNQVLYTMMHEFGHARNLEHSEIHSEYNADTNPLNDEFVPLMFPILPRSDTAIADGLMGGLNGIKLDDQFSLYYLYNSTLLAAEGRLQGHILDKNNKGILGVNVTCSDLNNADVNIVSWLSGSDLKGTGNYDCGHLPAGNYDVKISPVTAAINEWTQGTPPFIPAEYYNGKNESFDAATDALTDKSEVTVPSAATVTDINVLINNNGQITSSQKVSGTVAGSTTSLSTADLEYYIYVPRSATKVEFKLDSTPSASDLDLYGKCNTPFSLATATAGDFYNPTSATQQAEFAGAGDTGNEDVVLDRSSTPKIDNCEYHLLVVNYDQASAAYDLTATVTGEKPVLKADFSPTSVKQTSGETLVSNVVFEAENDQFTIHSIKFTDIGTDKNAAIQSAAIYYDANNNGRVDSDELALATTSAIDATTKSFTFSKVNIFLDEGQQKNFLVTYKISTSASSSYPMILFFVGLMTAAWFGRKKRSVLISIVLISFIHLSHCSSTSAANFNPQIQKSEDVSAVASAFGSQYDVQFGSPTSVKQFFE